MMTTGETVESAWDISMGNIINQLDPDSKKVARRLEKILIEKMKRNTPYCLITHALRITCCQNKQNLRYIYMYVCVCVCVCVERKNK